jgi:uncharacterized protein
MDIKTRLEDDLKDALRKGEETRKITIRDVLAAIKLAQVEKGKPVVDDNGIIVLIQKEAKSRKESIADAEKANRPDLITKYQAEIKVLEAYLPQQLSKEELTDMVRKAIEETGAKSQSDMGKVMKIVIPQVQGWAANDQISAAVRSLLEIKA